MAAKPPNPFSIPYTQGRRRVSCLLLASWIDATAPHNHNRHQLGIRTRDTRINNHQPSSFSSKEQSTTSRTCVSFQHGMVPQTEGLGPWRCWMLGLDHGDRIPLSISLSIVVASLRCARLSELSCEMRVDRRETGANLITHGVVVAWSLTSSSSFSSAE